MMSKRKCWIMTEAQIDSFQRYRIEKYKAQGKYKNNIDDYILTRFYAYTIIKFLRTRSANKFNFVLIQKCIYNAVCLFKRYYLVNQYGDNTHAQNALCAIYVSLKLNQFDEKEIQNLSKGWKTKTNQPFYIQSCIHFGQPGYSQKQLHFLRGIGFQVGRFPFVSIIESFHMALPSEQVDPKLRPQFWQQITRVAKRIYLDRFILFLVQPPKLALAAVLYTSRIMEQFKQIKLEDWIPKNVLQLIERNKILIESIIQSIANMSDFMDNQLTRMQVKQARNALIDAKKKRFEIPERTQSPRSPTQY